MSIFCALIGHTASTAREHNQEFDFSMCHHCGIDLIRSVDGDWSEVPKGLRVVRRALAGGDSAAVAQRLKRTAPPPRRDPRSARPTPRRDPRGRPLKSGPGMVMLLANLGWLVGDDKDDGRSADKKRERVIRLPGNVG